VGSGKLIVESGKWKVKKPVGFAVWVM